MILSCALLSALFAAPQETPPRPGQARESEAAPVNGLAWRASVQPELTSADAIIVEANLFNRSGEAQTVASQGTNLRPILRLTRAGAPTRTLVVEDRHGMIATGNARPKAGGVALGFSTDLRLYTGRLPEGSYELTVVLPADAYSLPDRSGFAPRDIESDVLSFRVVATTLADAERAAGQVDGVSFTVDAPESTDAGAIHRTARVRHALAGSIDIVAYVGTDTDRPLSTIMGSERWLPPHGWVATGGFGFCGTGLGEHSIEPGREQALHLPWLQHDGIYRFTLGARASDGTELALTSNAIRVDRLDAVLAHEK